MASPLPDAPLVPVLAQESRLGPPQHSAAEINRVAQAIGAPAGAPAGALAFERWVYGGGTGVRVRDARARWLRKQGWSVTCWSEGRYYVLLAIAPSGVDNRTLLIDTDGVALGTQQIPERPTRDVATDDALASVLSRALGEPDPVE